MAEDIRFGGLVCRIYGAAQAQKLFVFIHGDRKVQTGKSWAQAMVRASGALPIRAVAVVRPGYDDMTGDIPDDDQGHVVDQYTRKNIMQIGQAIIAMKQAWAPAITIGVGFSGGSACLGVLLGLVPNAVRHAVLVSGPLDLIRWRRIRGSDYPNSLSAMHYVDQIPKGTRIRCIHGAEDELIPCYISESYAQRARAAGLDATYQPVDGVGHYSHGSVNVLGDAAIKAARAL